MASSLSLIPARAAALAATLAAASAGAIGVDHPYARATTPGQPAGGGHVRLVNRSGVADRLVAATAAVSASVQLHEMRMDGDAMRMRQLESIDLPSGKTVELAPGGYHLMFVGLKAPLKAGESFPVRLVFEKAGPVSVEMKVEPPGVARP